MTFLIVLGASILLSTLVLIPAERQILRSRTDPNEHQPHYLYARKDYRWTSRLLEKMLTLGFVLLTMYILLKDPEQLEGMLEALF